MNLHGTVRGAITSVNPDQLVGWQASTGNTVDAAGKQSPTYAASVTVLAQVQPVPDKLLAHTDQLNIQGEYRVVYFYGAKNPIVRSEQLGGDLLTFPRVRGGGNGTWLIVQVLEQWPDWCKVLACLQQ